MFGFSSDLGRKKESQLNLFILQGLIMMVAQSKMHMGCVRPSNDPVAFSERRILQVKSCLHQNRDDCSIKVGISPWDIGGTMFCPKMISLHLLNEIFLYCVPFQKC